MTIPLLQTLDEAQLVISRDDPTQRKEIAVWHGGHTVNFYRLEPASPHTELHPVASISVGDYATGEVTEEEVRAGVRGAWKKVEP